MNYVLRCQDYCHQLFEENEAKFEWSGREKYRIKNIKGPKMDFVILI